jgi:hypothetical protein
MGLYIGKYPGGGISADVIWGNEYEKAKIKRGKYKRKRKKGERKRNKGEGNEKRGSKRVK